MGEGLHGRSDGRCVAHDGDHLEMSSKRLGLTCVVEGAGRLQGIITGGDLRRSMERPVDLLRLSARELMTSHPKTVELSTPAVEALTLMETYLITSLLIVDTDARPIWCSPRT